MTIEDLYAEKCASSSDISPLLPILRQYADECEVVVEFGVRHGYSTTAFLASKCKQVISYDINKPNATLPPDAAAKWGFVEVDTAMLETADIPICDLLFIDTLHTEAQVREELRQAVCARKYIIFHDTFTFGYVEEGYGYRGTPPPHPGNGILPAIFEFLVDHPEWEGVLPYDQEQRVTDTGETLMESKFKVGDVVKHRASLDKGVVTLVKTGCTIPEHNEGLFGCSGGREGCDVNPTGWYNISVGFGKEYVVMETVICLL